MAHNIKDYETAAKSLDSFLSQHPEGDLLLSSSHRNEIQDLDFLRSAQAQHVLQKHGFFHIALEAQKSFSNLAEKVADQKMTPDALGESVLNAYRAAGDNLEGDAAEKVRESYATKGRLIEESMKRGTIIHFVENQTPGLEDQAKSVDRIDSMRAEALDIRKRELEQMKEQDPTFKEKWEEDKDLTQFSNTPFSTEAHRRMVAIEAKIDRDNPRIQEIHNDIYQERNGYDHNLVQEIREQAGKGVRVLVFYGDTHGSQENDLDEALGPNTTRIVLASGPDDLAIKEQRDFGLGYQKPSAYLDLSTGKMESGDQAYAKAAQYTAPLYENPQKAQADPASDPGTENDPKSVSEPPSGVSSNSHPQPLAFKIN